MSGPWTHDALASDLAGYLRGPETMVWEDMQLGPSGSPRPDVYTLRRSYSKPMPTAFECKISRSDLRSDTTSGKWQSYLKYASSVTFAVPDGLCTVADIPDGCGLIMRKAETWRYARRPTLQRVVPPFDACMKLLIDGVSRLSVEKPPQPRTVAAWAAHEGVRKKFGEAVERAARDLVYVEQQVADGKGVAQRQYEEAVRRAKEYENRLLAEAKSRCAEYEQAKLDLCTWLKLDADASVWSVRQAIERLKRDCNADARVEKAEADLNRARHSISAALQSIMPAPAEQAA